MSDSAHDLNPDSSTPKPHGLDHPAPIEPIYNIDPFTPMFAPPVVISERMADSLEDKDATSATPDAIPDLEPSVPSLDAPDAGVFGHSPGKPAS